MPDPRSVMKEYRFLDQKRVAQGLSPDEEVRFAELRDLVGAAPASGGARPGFDVNAAAARLRESLMPAGLRNRPPPTPEPAPAPAPEPVAEPEPAPAPLQDAVAAAWDAQPFGDLGATAPEPLFDPGALAAEAEAPVEAAFAEAAAEGTVAAAGAAPAVYYYDPRTGAYYDPERVAFDEASGCFYDPTTSSWYEPDAVAWHEASPAEPQGEAFAAPPDTAGSAGELDGEAFSAAPDAASDPAALDAADAPPPEEPAAPVAGALAPADEGGADSALDVAFDELDFGGASHDEAGLDAFHSHVSAEAPPEAEPGAAPGAADALGLGAELDAAGEPATPEGWDPAAAWPDAAQRAQAGAAEAAAAEDGADAWAEPDPAAAGADPADLAGAPLDFEAEPDPAWHPTPGGTYEPSWDAAAALGDATAAADRDPLDAIHAALGGDAPPAQPAPAQDFSGLETAAAQEAAFGAYDADPGAAPADLEALLPFDPAADAAVLPGAMPPGFEPTPDDDVAAYAPLAGEAAAEVEPGEVPAELAFGAYDADAPVNADALALADPAALDAAPGAVEAATEAAPAGDIAALLSAEPPPDAWQPEAAVDQGFRLESGGSFDAAADAAAPEWATGASAAPWQGAPAPATAAWETPVDAQSAYEGGDLAGADPYAELPQAAGPAPELDFSAPDFSAGQPEDVPAWEAAPESQAVASLEEPVALGAAEAVEGFDAEPVEITDSFDISLDDGLEAAPGEVAPDLDFGELAAEPGAEPLPPEAAIEEVPAEPLDVALEGEQPAAIAEEAPVEELALAPEPALLEGEPAALESAWAAPAEADSAAAPALAELAVEPAPEAEPFPVALDAALEPVEQQRAAASDAAEVDFEAEVYAAAAAAGTAPVEAGPVDDDMPVIEGEEILEEVAAEEAPALPPLALDAFEPAAPAPAWAPAEIPEPEPASVAAPQAFAPPEPPAAPAVAQRAFTPPPAPTPPPPAVAELDDAGTWVAGVHRVVVHTMDGHVRRGLLENVDLSAPALRLLPQPGGAGTPEDIGSGDVKAIFFMLAQGESPPAPVGKRVRVTFRDGRQVAGFSPDYREGVIGFFMIPADARTSTGKIWVYQSSVRAVAVS